MFSDMDDQMRTEHARMKAWLLWAQLMEKERPKTIHLIGTPAYSEPWVDVALRFEPISKAMLDKLIGAGVLKLEDTTWMVW